MGRWSFNLASTIDEFDPYIFFLSNVANLNLKSILTQEQLSQSIYETFVELKLLYLGFGKNI